MDLTAESILEALQITHKASRILEAQPGALSAQQYAALGYFAGDPDRTLADLHRLMDVAPTVVTGIVDRLEKRGLIVRQVHPTDRRKHRMVLTTAGRQAMAVGTAALKSAA